MACGVFANWAKPRVLEFECDTKGAVHAAVTDVMVEERKYRSSHWEKASITMQQKGDERDDLKLHWGY